VRRVTVLLFGDDAHRCVANNIRRRQIGLAETQVDAARARAVEHLPDDALVNSL